MSAWVHPWVTTLVLAMAVSVAGCSSPASDAGVDVADPCVVEQADATACTDGELTGMDRPHLHDYWGGQERLVLTDVEQEAGTLLCTDVGDVAILRPLDGEAIIQGTSQVEATLTYDAQDANHLPAEFLLWVKTAADAQAVEVGPAVSGSVVVLPTTNEQNDLPHQALSAWEFQLRARPAGPTACFSYGGMVRLHVELQRGLEIPLYPGHPDRWDNATELPLLAHERSIFLARDGFCLAGPTGDGCMWEPHRPDNGTVVPHDAEAVVVRLDWLGDSPLRAGLGVHGADTRTFDYPEPAEVDANGRTYVLPALHRGDGPYAAQSQWEFVLVTEDPSPLYSGSYALTASAVRAPP